MIRIFKLESEFELWMQKEGRYELLARYPICHWSGSLGPKLTEGDRQSPEGLYSISVRQLHKTGRWRRSLDIGFPNTFDRAHGRTGSYILVHGGCTSIGCYAMTTPVMDEIYALSEAALRQGQEHIPVHVFPFRMTQQNLHSTPRASGVHSGPACSQRMTCSSGPACPRMLPCATSSTWSARTRSPKPTGAPTTR